MTKYLITQKQIHLDKRRNYQLLVLVYKALNSLEPPYIREFFFKLMTVKYNLEGIGTKLV